MQSQREKVEELIAFKERLMLCGPVKAIYREGSGNETLAHLCRRSSTVAYRTRAWRRWLELKRD